MTRPTLDRLVRDGQWANIERGIYLTRPGEPDWAARVWIASLLGGEDCAVSGASALAWCDLLPAHSGPVEVMIDQSARLTERRGVTFRRGLTHRKTITRRGLRVVAPTDAIVDASADLTTRELEGVIAKAAQQRVLSKKRLRELLGSRRSAPARALLREVAEDAAHGAHSSLELEYLRHVERAHCLPTGRRQAKARGRREFRDIEYDVGLVVELDGLLGHLGEGFRDRRRDNRNALEGAITLRYGWSEVTGDPCGIAREVAEALISLGWGGMWERCAACLPLVS